MTAQINTSYVKKTVGPNKTHENHTGETIAI